MMNIIHEPSVLRDWCRSPALRGKSIGFVPTMGALHAGHESLLERARRECDRLVVSIFVNATQFNDPADCARYPQPREADLEICERHQVDAVFVPGHEQLYPDAYRYRVDEVAESSRLEGEHRPGHFTGVLTVVMKLLQLVSPQRAYFGEKDWQQLELVRGMVDAFFLPVDIVGCPTIRDRDGLALSSRNRRLSSEGRARAAAFPHILRHAMTVSDARSELEGAGFEVDYVEECGDRRFGAVILEGVRLIDNLVCEQAGRASA